MWDYMPLMKVTGNNNIIGFVLCHYTCVTIVYGHIPKFDKCIIIKPQRLHSVI